MPSFILVTDAERGGDPIHQAAALAPGDAVLLRHYRHPARERLHQQLAALCRRRRLGLIVAVDADQPLPNLPLRLRPQCGGIHLGAAGGRPPRYVLMRYCRFYRGRLITAAVHHPRAMWHNRGAIDAMLLSPVFATASHPGAAGLGALRFAAWAALAGCPTYALGGVGVRRSRRLCWRNLAGIASVSAWSHA